MNLAISPSKMAILLAILFLSFGGIFFIFNDEPNAKDLSLMGFFLLTGGILAQAVNYARTAHLENAIIRKRTKKWMKLRDHISPDSVFCESGDRTVGGKPTVGKIYAQTLEQECATSLNTYLETKDRKSLKHTLSIIETLEEREGRSLSGSLSTVKRYLIVLILALAIALRLYHLDAPILGVESWRQADTASIARNFFENGFRFFYPQIDWGGSSSGYVESEFPIYPFIVGLCYKLFGFTEQWGRLLSVIFWLTSVYVLYLIVRKHIGLSEALWSCLFLSILPVSLYYSRAFMPESSLIMCSLLGIYFFSQWLTTGAYRHFFLSALFVALACLIKIPTLYLGLPLAYLAWVKYGGKIFSQLRLWLFLLMVLIPVGSWYCHAHQLFIRSGLTFGIWGFGIDKWGNWDLLVTVKFWNQIIFQSLFKGYLTWAGVPVFFMGIIIKRKQSQEMIFDFWLIAVVMYFMIVTSGNYAHEYYQLPFIVPASVFMGKALARYMQRDRLKTVGSILIGICTVGVLVLSVARYYIYLANEDRSCQIMLLAQEVQQTVDKNALVMAVDSGDPTMLYLAHRKGWHAWPNQMEDSVLSERMRQGAEYILGVKYSFKDDEEKKRLAELLDQYEVVSQTRDYFILKMQK